MALVAALRCVSTINVFQSDGDSQHKLQQQQLIHVLYNIITLTDTRSCRILRKKEEEEENQKGKNKNKKKTYKE